MVETFLLSIAERVLEKMVDRFVEEVSLAINVKNDWEKLKKTMKSIKAGLLDAERQQHHNEKLQLCMRSLRDILYDAEDVIDDFKCEALRKQVANHPNFSFKMRFLASWFFPPAFSCKMGRKIQQITQRLDELDKEWKSFNLGESSVNRQQVLHRETHSSVSPDFIGRDEDKKKIIGLLMEPSEGGSIPVIPIVGMGGLGKTMLAKSVYNDDRVTQSFKSRIWICVSYEFDLRGLLIKIMQSITDEEKKETVKWKDYALEALKNSLKEVLKDKEFLLFLDDVWNVDHKQWIDFSDVLRSMDGFSKSKIIVTTRNPKVAELMNSLPPHELEGLPRDHCLTLFKKRAFKDGDENNHPNLMRFGEEIVTKCQGNPLAVETLGSLLKSKTDESDWISVRDSEIWTLDAEGGYDILEVLKLSYVHLPSHLQRCLALLSLFKKDHLYDGRHVIQLWMANGLLDEHSEENQEWEKVGCRYLDELLSRSLIQLEREYNWYFHFKRFTIHDLMHDLLTKMSLKEFKIVDRQTGTVNEDVRHLSFSDSELQEVPQALKKLKNVRTVIANQDSRQSKSFHESLIELCVSNYKYLRALSLRESKLTALPNSIGKLKHLRDLDLSMCDGIRELPTSFYKLRRLQQLSMGGTSLMQLPDDVETFIELGCLEITIEAKRMKEIRPGCWTCLKDLVLFGCLNLECLPDGLQNLTSLRRLLLTDCRSLVSLPRSLKLLTKLEYLLLRRCYMINLGMEPEEGEEDTDLQLGLKYFLLEELNTTTDLPRLLLEGSSSTLQQIQIDGCENLGVLPAWLSNLTSLQKLEISYCPKLSALPEGMDRLTELKLVIKNCPDLSKRYRKDGGEDWHKIAKIKEVNITDQDDRRISLRHILESIATLLASGEIALLPSGGTEDDE